MQEPKSSKSLQNVFGVVLVLWLCLSSFGSASVLVRFGSVRFRLSFGSASVQFRFAAKHICKEWQLRFWMYIVIPLAVSSF